MKPKIILVAIASTTLKKMPLPEEMLTPSQKMELKEGDTLEIDRHTVINNHLVIECFNDFGKWYVDASTVEITPKK